MARLQPHLGLLPPDVEVKMAEVNEVKEVHDVIIKSRVRHCKPQYGMVNNNT